MSDVFGITRSGGGVLNGNSAGTPVQSHCNGILPAGTSTQVWFQHYPLIRCVENPEDGLPTFRPGVHRDLWVNNETMVTPVPLLQSRNTKVT